MDKSVIENGNGMCSDELSFVFGDASLSFTLFLDERGMERGKFSVDASRGVQSSKREYNPYKGDFYINNLYGFYKIIFEGVNGIHPLSGYSSSIKKGNKKFSIFNVKRVSIPKKKREEILKRLSDSLMSRVQADNEKLKDLYKKNGEYEIFKEKILSSSNNSNRQDKILKEGVELFSPTESTTNGEEKEVSSFDFNEELLDILGRIEKNFDSDMYSLFGKKFLNKKNSRESLMAVYDKENLALEFMVNKEPISYSRFLLDFVYLEAIKEIIENFLSSLPKRRGTVSLSKIQNGNGKGFLIIDKKDNFRTISSTTFSNMEVRLDPTSLYLLKNALKIYAERGRVSKIYTPEVSFHPGEGHPVLKLNDFYFDIEGRDTALQLYFYLL